MHIELIKEAIDKLAQGTYKTRAYTNRPLTAGMPAQATRARASTQQTPTAPNPASMPSAPSAPSAPSISTSPYAQFRDKALKRGWKYNKNSRMWTTSTGKSYTDDYLRARVAGKSPTAIGQTANKAYYDRIQTQARAKLEPPEPRTVKYTPGKDKAGRTFWDNHKELLDPRTSMNYAIDYFSQYR